MATKLYLRNVGTIALPTALGQKFTNQAGSAAWWNMNNLHTVAGAITQGLSLSSVAGPTSGIEPLVGSLACYFLSNPLSAAATISGTISFNLWGSESDMKANGALACRIDKVSGVDFSLTTISTSVDDAELGTAAAAMTWTTTPTSTAFAKGDRIRAVVYFDDAPSASMASGYQFVLNFNSDVANAADSWIQFNENLSFMTFSGVTQVFPTDTASDVDTASIDKKAWTTRGT